jgi:hypothetical protein
MREPMPIIAYYCKLYAVQHGMTLCEQHPDQEKRVLAKNYLIGELGELEAMKQAMGDPDKEA